MAEKKKSAKTTLDELARRPFGAVAPGEMDEAHAALHATEDPTLAARARLGMPVPAAAQGQGAASDSGGTAGTGGTTAGAP